MAEHPDVDLTARADRRGGTRPARNGDVTLLLDPTLEATQHVVEGSRYPPGMRDRATPEHDERRSVGPRRHPFGPVESRFLFGIGCQRVVGLQRLPLAGEIAVQIPHAHRIGLSVEDLHPVPEHQQAAGPIEVARAFTGTTETAHEAAGFIETRTSASRGCRT